MTPLEITAEVYGPVASHAKSIALDALLMALVAERTNLPSLQHVRAAGQADPVIEIPLAKSKCGRVYLASRARIDHAAENGRFARKRPVVQHLVQHTALARANVQNGADKAWQVPYTEWVGVPQLTWWCVGDRKQITELLSGCTNLGGRRGTGHGSTVTAQGRVSWVVRPVEVWPGFPVLDRTGRPTRNLPMDWPGMVAERFAIVPLSPPYWDSHRGEMCAVG